MDLAQALPEPDQPAVAGLVLAHAREAPERVAVSQDRAFWTYGELVAAARRQAAALAAAGLAAGEVVAIEGRRTPGMVAAMLATLLAGGAFLTVDRSLPRRRRRLMLRRGRARWLLTPGADLRVTTPRPLRSSGVAGTVPPARRKPGAAAGDPAYVFFTSGTSGEPNPVLGSQRGLSHFVAWQRREFEVGARDRVAQLTGLSFDVLLRDVFLPLTGGASLHLPGRELSTTEVLPWLARLGITLLHAVPSLAQAWLAAGPQAVPSLRWVFFAGEPLPDSLVRRWRRVVAPAAGVANLYGPTETTLAKCCFRVPEEAVAGIQPVGWPLPQTQVLVMSATGDLCATGEVGEVVLRTPFRSLGYLDPSGEAAGRFVPNPFRDDPGDLLYRTGDLGRLEPDGRLQVLGRLDQQVKVRGVRVDPAEVMAVLAGHPGIALAAVVPHRDPRGEVRLAAYAVPRGRDRPTAADLRRYLAARLHPAMVPALWVLADDLPRTATGKLDLRFLPPPGLGTTPAAPPVPPRDGVEEALVGLWAEVLETAAAGAHDDFFALGGDSLSGTRLLGRIRRLFEVELTLEELVYVPTLAGMAARVRRGLAGARLPQEPIAPVPAGVPRRLSFAQERLWFLDRLAPGAAAYHLPAAWSLAGELDARALTAALAEIVRRHETLRSSFPDVGGAARLRLDPADGTPLPTVDLQGLAAGERAAAAVHLAARDAVRPFALATGTGFRAALLRHHPARHTLLVSLHHIAADGWSRALLQRELGLLYAACREGRPSPLEPPAVRYSDFAHWQRRRLERGVLDGQLAYWRHRLRDLQELDLPCDRPRPPLPGADGGEHTWALDREQVARLRQLCAAAGASLSMALLAAFDLLLVRTTSQRDLALGLPVAGRNRVEIEGLIGLFVNPLVLRIRVRGDPSFSDLLARVREAALGAYAHQDLPFERLVEELAPVREPSANPLFRVALALHNHPRADLELPGLAVERLDPGLEAVRFDLELHLQEEAGGLGCRAQFSRRLFDRTTVVRMMRHWVGLLGAVARWPDRPLSSLPLLSAAERHQLLWEWSRAGGMPAAVTPVHRLLRRRTRSQPDSTAVVDEGRAAGPPRHLSYRTLGVLADRLAGRLRALGAGAETLVALPLPVSGERVVALAGVAAAGAASLLLDPQQPPGRISALLQAAGLPLVIARGRRPLPVGAPAHGVLMLDLAGGPGALGGPAGEGAAEPPAGAVPDGLAYTLYTSGSTGVPKGVEATRGGLSNLVAWHLAAFRPGPGDRASLLAAPGFDASLWEVWPALAAGASLHVPPPGAAGTAARLCAWLAGRGITHCFAPTPLAEELLAAVPGDRPPPPALRWLLTGGDVLHRRPAAGLPFRLANQYGPTETTVVTTWTPVAPGAGGLPTIGRPIAGAGVVLMDPGLRPAPVGAPGEVLISGRGLARGYRDEPGQTAAAFIPDPVSPSPGERLYRSGDLARARVDGEIEFLRRRDDQIQLRGLRIEPAEIEAALSRHPAVHEAAVVAREAADGGRRLVAYAVRRQDDAAEAPWDLREGGWIERWRSLYDDLHSGGAAATGEPDFRGWTSSYTGRPLPVEEMEEWRAGTVERIRSLGAGRILEIGCGNGLLLTHLAPECSRYVGTDFSRAALGRLEEALAGSGTVLAQVELLHRRADDLTGIPAGAFDAVVLNSVVQYFPGVPYLLEVLNRAAEAVRPGGALLVGDMRCLPLLGAFCASVEVERAPAGLSVGELQRRVAERVRREEELVVDPAFFPALAAELPRLRWVRVLPKLGRSPNELNLFRYDVILHLDAAPPAAPAPAWLDWEADAVSRSSLAATLAADRPRALGIRGVPDPRLSRAAALVRLLENPRHRATRALRRALARATRRGIEPADLEALGREHGYELAVCRWDWRPEGGYEAVLHRRGTGPAPSLGLPGAPGPPRPWAAYGNDPRSGERERALTSELRAHLAGRLPAFMVPAAIVFVDRLPKSASGKLDRRALPPEPAAVAASAAPWSEPRSPLERSLAEVWAQVLGVGRVGARDDFFELGGHSLLAVRLVGEMERHLGVSVPLATLLGAPTVEGVARSLGGSRTGPGAPVVALRPGGSGRPLFWFHAAGGSVHCYRDLTCHLGGGRPVYGIQEPERFGESPRQEPSITDLARHGLGAIRRLQPRGPLLLGGWSMGGLVAMEAARLCSAGGGRIAGLVLLDPTQPHRPASAARDLESFANSLGLAWSETWSGGSPEEGLARIGEELARAGGQAPEIDPRDLAELHRRFSGHVRAARAYRLRTLAADALLVTPREPAGQVCRASARTWRRVLTGPLEAWSAPGDHFSMLREPHAAALAARLDRYLRGK